MLKLDEVYLERIFKSATEIADWYVYNQELHNDGNACAGSLPGSITEYNLKGYGQNWTIAFGVMGLLSASEILNNDIYKISALRAGRYLKTLQIFDIFNKKHYGAIRERSPQTPWCYTRDALSTAWSFIDLYRFSGESEYLERAKLWGEWFLKEGRDEEGWSLWGIQFEPWFENSIPQMCNDIQGSFQGGSLNFFYHLYKETDDERWLNELITCADFLITHIQQPNGLFSSIERSTKKAPKNDPQLGLHKTNDDLASLGLLCAWKQTGDKKYIKAIKRYIAAIFERQKENGAFDQTVSSIPVVLNIIFELEEHGFDSEISDQKQLKALDKLLNSQSSGSVNPATRGGIMEWVDEDIKDVVSRSSAYSLIYLLKLYNGKSSILSL